MTTPFDAAMDSILHSQTQRAQSKKLRNIAEKITKVQESFNIPVEYIVGDES